MDRRARQRAIVSIGVIASTLALGAVPATADRPETGRCPHGYTMVTAASWGEEGEAIDRNGDGDVCEKPLPGDDVFNVIDNNSQKPE